MSGRSSSDFGASLLRSLAAAGFGRGKKAELNEDLSGEIKDR